MGTREEVFKILDANRGVFISGEELANALHVSRNAVWKAIQVLRENGQCIEAGTNKGYMLPNNGDILTMPGVRRFLDEKYRLLDIRVYDKVSSTNNLVKEQAAMGSPEGFVIVASGQTNGRGRLGRSFYSPEETGIYMSILLRPNVESGKDAVAITTIAAVAAAEAVELACGKKTEIKWVNDIMINGKKVCGILTEASFGLEDGKVECVVLGLGFNVYTPSGGFPAEIADIAGSIFDDRVRDGRNKLVADFLNLFFGYYEHLGDKTYAEKYKERCMVLGKDIYVISSEGKKPAKALDLDEDCRLLVEYEDRTTGWLTTGEISVRIKE